MSHFKGEESEAQKVRGSFKFLQLESGRVRTHLDLLPPSGPVVWCSAGELSPWGSESVLRLLGSMGPKAQRDGKVLYQ